MLFIRNFILRHFNCFCTIKQSIILLSIKFYNLVIGFMPYNIYRLNIYVLKFPKATFVFGFIITYIIANICLNPSFTAHAGPNGLSWNWIQYSEITNPLEENSTPYQIDEPPTSIVQSKLIVPQEMPVMPTKLTVPKPIPSITSTETTSVIPAIDIVPKTSEIQATQVPKTFEKTSHQLTNVLQGTIETKHQYAMPVYDENQPYIYSVSTSEQKSKIAQILVQFANDPKNSEVIFESFMESQLSIYLPVKDQLVSYLKPFFPPIDANLYSNPKLRERALEELFDLANATKNPVFIHGITVIKYCSIIANGSEQENIELTKSIHQLYNSQFSEVIKKIDN